MNEQLGHDAMLDMGASTSMKFVAAERHDARLSLHLEFACFDMHGNLKWVEETDNLLATVGGNFVLDTVFAGSAYTAAWFLGLKGAGTFAAADTMASHAGWAEITAYSNATRIAPVWSAASAGSKASSALSFTINGTATVAGAFLTTVSTIGGTTGTLYSAADFASSRSVASGDTLAVTPTLTIA